MLDAKGAHYTTPMMQLQDSRRTKVLLVTLAETTPVLEAANLQADLRRAGIEPWAWVINNSVAAARPRSPLLRQRAHNELGEVEKVATGHARRYAVVPLSEGRAGRRAAPAGISGTCDRTSLMFHRKEPIIMSEATAVTSNPETSKAPAMGVFERFLTLWVALCIIAGIVLGQTMPAVFRAIGAATVAEVNLPVAVLVWLMIIPMLLKIDLAALGQVKNHWRGIVDNGRD